MNLSRRRIFKYVRGNLMVFVVFFGVFTLTFYANVIFVDLEDEVREDEEDSVVKRRNGIENILQIIFWLVEMLKSPPTQNLTLQNGIRIELN